MRKSRLDRPHTKLWIAGLLADGRSQREIAQALDCSQPTISRIAKQDDVRVLIQAEEEKLIKQVEEILEKIRSDPRFLSDFQKRLEKELLNF